MGSQENLTVLDLTPQELRASGEEFSREAPQIVRSLALSLGSGFTLQRLQSRKFIWVAI